MSDVRVFRTVGPNWPRGCFFRCLLDPSLVGFAFGFTGLVFGWVAVSRGQGMPPDRR